MDPSREPEAAFADALQRRAPAEVAAFVAELWRARGWDVTADGDRLEAVRTAPTAERRRIHVVDAGSGAPAPADVVVTAGRAPPEAPDAEVVTADDLYRMVRFGLDRAAGERLLEAHLGLDAAVLEAPRPVTEADASPEAPASTAGDAGRPWGEWAGLLRGARSVSPVTVVAAVVLVSAAVLGAAGGPAATVEPLAASLPGSSSAVPEGVASTPVPTATPASSPDGDTDPLPVARQSRYLEATPTCERPPGLVVVIIVGALAANDPETDDGIDTAWRFSFHPETSIKHDFVRFLRQPEFALLFSHDTAEFGPVIAHEEDIVSQRVRLSNRTRSRSFQFVVAQDPVGELEGCWRLAGILLDDANGVSIRY